MPLANNPGLYQSLVKIGSHFDSEEFTKWWDDYFTYCVQLGEERNKKKRSGLRHSDPVKRFRKYLLDLMSGSDDYEIEPTSVPYDLVYTALIQLGVKFEEIHDMFDTLEDMYDVDLDNVDETTSNNVIIFVEKMEDLAEKVVKKVK